MSSPKFQILLFIFSFFAYLECNCQEINFESLTEENVFDKQPVLSISQDSEGRLWFAGQNNIFNYNSRQIQNLVDSDSTFGGLGYITKIAINDNDNLFIASSTHLFIFDIHNRKWVLDKDRPFKKGLVVYNFLKADSRFFICAEDGLYEANPNSGSFTLDKILSRNKVQAIVKINNEQYVISSDYGVELVALKGKTVVFTKNLEIPIKSSLDNVIPSLFFEHSSLWVATKFNGLFHYNFANNEWKDYNDKNSNILSNNVRVITRDPTGRLLVGTLKGLSILSDNQRLFYNYKHNALTKQSLSQNSIYDIFVDNQQIVWLGTYFGGLNAIYPNFINFRTTSTKSPAPFRLNSDIISDMVETHENYWIASEEEGINLVDKTTGEAASLPKLTQSNLVKDLYIRNNKVYIAQYAGGYSIFDLTHKKSTHFNLGGNEKQLKNNVFSIYVDSAENIFLGTNAGLYYKGRKNELVLIKGLPQVVIHSLKEDRKHNLYALSEEKLFKKSVGTMLFKEVAIPADLPVNGFFIDNNNELWFTSRQTIYKINDRGQLMLIAEFKNNTLGWPIIVDNILWVTSKSGLIYYDLNTKYSNLYNQYDGLPGKNLQNAKLFLSESGSIFLITLNGLTSFNPRKISLNKQIPSIILGNIKINDKLLSFDRLVSQQNENSYTLSLNHDENFLAVDFASSNFIKSKKNRYRYKLEGFDKEWIEVEQPSIRYTNIPEGEYKLLLQVSNNDLVWSTTPLQIKLVVLPPIWKTWWAYLLYAIIIAGILHFSITIIVERQLLLSAEKEQSKKIKFFTQISHEIRTPLTLITIPIEEIIKSTEEIPTVQFKAIRLKKNADKLLHIVNELLDFKKFDDGKETIHLKSVSLKPYLEDVFYLFSDLALSKKLNYYIKSIEGDHLIFVDTSQFDKAIFNLLSNAIKYCNVGGSVFMEIHSSFSETTIRIADNGIGVSENNQFQIFEEYYRAPNANDNIGTGIGLALTKKIVEEHKGTIKCKTETIDNQQFTVFTLTLPSIPNVESENILNQEAKDTVQISTAFTKHTKNETLLLIEDNVELADTIQKIFIEHYKVFVAYNGEEGLEQALQIIPDIIISDVMMPRMNGLEMCKKIKSNILTSHIPLILLTADTSELSQVSGLQYGANVYLSKPFNPQLLLLTVRNLLEIASKKREEFKIENPHELSALDHDFISTLESIINTNLINGNFGVDLLARELGMSQPVLYKKLKSITNLSVNNFIKQYRFMKAIELLRFEKNISQVAYAVGFSDRKYFSKEFKKHFGKNPSEFLKDENLEG
ncbi:MULTISPECIES: hybrid sensor histidine kinase/response regulator transcription factor [Sphingobacterium]|uniref:hybrid sensor histidine kinase/response regulator transcription factor n=1 Tax=Sphingobacterium TaxID=28453 RepID=UPI0013DA18EA|nr:MULTISPECIES: hybrid sensor histidine kinase/response regulator transcription factor [unclassified Sphingobacterium]